MIRQIRLNGTRTEGFLIRFKRIVGAGETFQRKLLRGSQYIRTCTLGLKAATLAIFFYSTIVYNNTSVSFYSLLELEQVVSDQNLAQANCAEQ